jgi:hypothetical protein
MTLVGYPNLSSPTDSGDEAKFLCLCFYCRDTLFWLTSSGPWNLRCVARVNVGANAKLGLRRFLEALLLV